MDARLASLLTVVALLYACTTDGEVLTSFPPREAIVPRAAGEFIDSIGISIPPHQYAPSFDAVILPGLAELGVRHVREWAVVPSENDQAEAQLAALETLAEVGVRSHLIFEPRFGVQAAHVAAVAERLGDALESVEGPNDNDANEIDLSADEVVSYLRDLRAAIDAAGLDGRVALVDSLDLEPADKGDLSDILDYGNFERPRDTALPSADLGEAKQQAREVCGGKPIMITECGYSTAPTPTGVSERSAAKYLLRLVLGHFMQNIARTYIDELTDGPEDPSIAFMSQGLLHLDGSPKPAFGALQRLIALLDDADMPAAAVPLELVVAGESPDLRRLLLQKADGSYWLALWLEVASFDASTRKELDPEPIKVTVTLPAPAGRLAVYEPLDEQQPIIERRDVAELTLEVADHPAIIAIEPKR